MAHFRGPPAFQGRDHGPSGRHGPQNLGVARASASQPDERRHHASEYRDSRLHGAHSLEEAVALFPADEEVFVIGGAQIYAAALPLARKFYLTRVFRAYEGDTRFPAWDEREWRLVSSESFSGGKDYPWPFAFELYERR